MFDIKAVSRFSRVVALAALCVSLGACGSLSRSQKHAAIGAGAGGAIGYVLTGGPVGTIVGAAAGGLIGAGHWACGDGMCRRAPSCAVVRCLA
ncbi:YMGG-like glycine zipper-containing protein [Paraburkholderia sp.]|uniref:YMGG-like glycine zipper-containing protein n=1 Tax=Paraburkholderia sp. TaxID=1926495 RepID=UPI002386C52A|nr:YMGG-like glycine zipper-containing protein [Paraburkholderia sp.]MDE1183759.1 hypothetical protein [Paraburkholderia sp.]